MKFSFRRFGQLFKLQLAVNRNLYLLGIASITGILLGFMLFLLYQGEYNYSGQEFTFVAGLLLSSTVFSSIIFKQFAQTDDRTMAMMLPASAGERLAVALVLCLLIFPLIYTLIWLPCNVAVNYFDLRWGGAADGLYLPGGRETLVSIMVNVLLQSFILLGAIWFRKHIFVKSVICVCVIMFAFTLLTNKSGEAMINSARTVESFERDIWYSFDNVTPYNSINLRAHKKVAEGTYSNIGPYYHVKLPASAQLVFLLVLCLAPVTLWVITWMKIREQQL